MAKNVYHMGYLLPNAHFDAPRVFDRYEETLEAHGASQRHNTRATLFHLRFVQGDTFRIGYARRTVQTPPRLDWDGNNPKHFLVSENGMNCSSYGSRYIVPTSQSDHDLANLTARGYGFCFLQLTTWADIAQEAARFQAGDKGAFYIWFQVSVSWRIMHRLHLPHLSPG